ncbi:MAG: hypothetical protein KF866_02265 [Phycisphaeraceae bacterium]|nr:hypothetical protein [Phycisphaeraceae bacterium]MCW5753482.1 hypothetical protein [Phycisphaeraceae bacterium]
MAKFAFRLETVLMLREREEQARRIELAELERVRLDLERRLRDGQEQLDAQRLDLRARLNIGNAARPSERVDVVAVRGQAAASLHVLRQMQRLAVEIAGVERRIEVARGRLVEAMARRRAIERLRESQLADWKQLETRTQIAETDDLTQSRFGAWSGDAAGALAPGRVRTER